MVSNKRFCGQCGVEVPVDDRFCGSCGHKLGQQAASSSSEPAPKSDHDSNYKTNYRKNFMQEWESKIQKDSTSSPSEPIPTSAPETLTKDSRSPVQRFLEQEQEAAEVTKCGFCDGGFIEKQVAFSPAGRVRSTTEPSEQIIRKVTCPHCDGTGTEKQDNPIDIVEPSEKKPSKQDQFVAWGLFSLLILVCTAVTWMFTLQAEETEHWSGRIEPTDYATQFVAGLIIASVVGLVGSFIISMIFDLDRYGKVGPWRFLKPVSEGFDRRSAERAKRRRANEGSWNKNLQVICPHCNVKGSVYKYFPPPPLSTGEQLSKDFRRALLSLVLKDPAETTTDEDIKAIRDNTQKPKPPNMKCTNCNMQWSV